MRHDDTEGDSNPYHDAELADVYAEFQFDGTYFLLARDLPGVIKCHVNGGSALDFACGAGRSTRLLKRLEFETVGVDISREMLARASHFDPDGTYILIKNGDLGALRGRHFDLVLSAFPFSSINRFDRLPLTLISLRERLSSDGRLIVVEPTPEFYWNEWLTFTTDYAENVDAKNGDPVRAAFRDRLDYPVVDFFWNHEAYQRAFKLAGFNVLQIYRPLGLPDDPYSWVNEGETPPWVIYVLAAKARPQAEE